MHKYKLLYIVYVCMQANNSKHKLKYLDLNLIIQTDLDSFGMLYKLCINPNSDALETSI